MHSRLTSSFALASFAFAALAGCGPADAERDVVPRDQDDVATEATAGAVTPLDDDRPTVVFLGTSLTAGLGLADPDESFPGVLQARIDSLDLEFRVVNGGVSGDTSAGGLDRLDWLLDSPLHTLILELGANDGLRGLSTEALEENLTQIIDRTRERHPQARIILAGMEAPPNLGARYTDSFRQVFIDVAESKDAQLIPFLLDGVAAVPELNQDDRIHPTAEGHRVIAETVWTVLAPVLGAS